MASALLGNLLETQITETYSKPMESEILGLKDSSLWFNLAFQELLILLMFENS